MNYYIWGLEKLWILEIESIEKRISRQIGPPEGSVSVNKGEYQEPLLLGNSLAIPVDVEKPKDATIKSGKYKE